ncbi:hypothetical protein [Variovorax ginsengisoli]|uniref:Carboxypeptidase regulatory-like domain-containing protein n=1 Tax=Variovorax ginsengisoli TaxID=363844 RepID=A0ABT9S5T0_9BURK|nr:hypothetical protein [Variovorax ginsengisoli]MDP9899725.1 hypothetical protein [Variovorax ginsengisoli]
MAIWHTVRPLVAAMVFGAGLVGALSAQAVTNPPIHMAHGIEYMSGGIGSDEARFMETISPRWPATLEFATQDHKSADFAADVRVTVRNANGQAVLDHVLAGGPFLVARLEPGTYEVEAVLAGQTLKQPLTVHAGTGTRSVFLWPAHTDMAASNARAPL